MNMKNNINFFQRCMKHYVTESALHYSNFSE